MAKDPTAGEIRQHISARLKRARIDADLTQKEMAEKLGIPEPRYAKYENRSPIPAYLVPRVCEVLGMTSWYLLTGKFNEQPTMASKDDASSAAGDRPFTKARSSRSG